MGKTTTEVSYPGPESFHLPLEKPRVDRASPVLGWLGLDARRTQREDTGRLWSLSFQANCCRLRGLEGPAVTGMGQDARARGHRPPGLLHPFTRDTHRRDQGPLPGPCLTPRDCSCWTPLPSGTVFPSSHCWPAHLWPLTATTGISSVIVYLGNK